MSLEITMTRPPAARPATAPAAEPAHSTTEQRKEAARAATDTLFGRRPSGAAPTVSPAVAAAMPVPEAPTLAPAAPAAAPRPPVTLSDDVGAVVVAARRGAAPVAIPAPAIDFEIAPEDKEDLDVINWLAQREAQHAGAPAKYLAFLKKAYEYQDKWAGEHPEEAFDPDAEEHASFYAQNPNPIDTQVVERARIDKQVDDRLEPERQKLKDEREALDFQRQFNQRQAEISRNMDTWTFRMVEAVNPELAKLLKNGEDIVLDKTTVAAVDAADPMAFKILNALDQAELRPFLVVLEQSVIPGFKWDPRNPRHAEVLRYRDQLDRDLLRLPEEQQQRDGRRFLTAKQYEAARAAILNGAGGREDKESKLQELNEGTWRVTVDDIADLKTDEVATQAKSVIEEFEEPARRKYKKDLAIAPNEPAPAPAPEPEPAPEPVRQPSPAPSSYRTNRPAPAGPGGFDGVPTGRPAAGGAESLPERVTGVLFRK